MFPWWWSMTSQAQKCGSWNLSVRDEQRGVGIPLLGKLYEVLTQFPPCLLMIWTVLLELWRKPSYLPFPICVYCLMIVFKIQVLPKATWSSVRCQLSPIESGWLPHPTLEVAQGSDATLLWIQGSQVLGQLYFLPPGGCKSLFLTLSFCHFNWGW